MPTVSPARLAPDHLAPLLDDWRVSLAAKNRSPQTIKSYLTCANNLLRFLAAQGMPQTASGIAREHIEAFIVDRLENASDATAAKHYRSLQQLFKWLDEDGEIENSPMLKMSPPAVVDNPPDILTTEEVQKLLNACKGPTFEARRDLALITFLFDGGCRVGEIAGMKTIDYDRERKFVTVTGKGGRTRGIGTGAKTIEAFRRYERVRRSHPLANTTDAFWLGRKGPLSISGIEQLLNRRCKDVGLPRINPHRFRHTWAHNWQVAGGSETDMMAAAGWRSREMAARYARSAAGERAQNSQRALSAADRLLK
jgi:site-specific recombinase XerD